MFFSYKAEIFLLVFKVNSLQAMEKGRTNITKEL